MYSRKIQQIIENQLFKGKTIVLYGARQVGKTTLVKNIISKVDKKTKYVDCDLFVNRQALEGENIDNLKKFIGDNDLVVIDEAQRVKNIGLNLKIIHDHLPQVQIIATGSSSFDLANSVSEPMTGRVLDYMLFPFSIEEVKQNYDYTDLTGKLENILIYGLYPDVFDKSADDAQKLLNNLASNYLYKDILEFDNIKKPEQLLKILQLLALQVGGEVSFSEIGQKLGLSTLTVQRYISLLEKTFVIFQLRGFSRNLRKEITKNVKIYFWDLGIRNSLIKNFNQLAVRNDVGALWENFCIVERLKNNNNHQKFVNSYFWRTYDQKEIDYIEEADGKLSAFEFKWGNDKKVKMPKEFLDTYADSQFKVIDQSNFDEF